MIIIPSSPCNVLHPPTSSTNYAGTRNPVRTPSRLRRRLSSPRSLSSKALDANVAAPKLHPSCVSRSLTNYELFVFLPIVPLGMREVDALSSDVACTACGLPTTSCYVVLIYTVTRSPRISRFSLKCGSDMQGFDTLEMTGRWTGHLERKIYRYAPSRRTGDKWYGVSGRRIT